MSESARGPVTRLLHSSKALVVLAATSLAFLSLYLGKTTWADLESFLKWVLGPWLAAVGLEDAARNVAEGLKARASAVSAPSATPHPSAETPSP